ncbi:MULTISPECIES: MobA/MobL family protein [unclassified Acidovorax]|uniref:MobA/MobL family protein n=1 Tax=unclassified Acidovorax TaxID=2684926 RepID=UPI001C46966A|nr:MULTISPECIES: MobA/MobL family protein [unclassified Acidovorax]MBV7427230.1 MobA/MobL family protein [Acidovorax sp. sif0732]MBV7448354.1 MobA/MobL family protein [Acidovorax sp. sif0715]
MAIFHLSARAPITRASGRSATAAAAYRAGALICDERTGLVFDYRRRHGVLDARIQLPAGRHVADRQQFWNGVEVHHRRRDAVLAREIVLALPTELGAYERAELAFGFAREIADEYGVGVDCALHAPSRDGDDRNFHAHLLLTACTVDADGVFGKKAERLDPIACKRSGSADSVSWLRPRWQEAVNTALARKGSYARVDHRSFKARGIERLPTVHVGINGAAARERASLNARLRRRNARVADIDEQMIKLMRMKARLAARTEPKPDVQRPVHADDRASDLLVWRRCPQPAMPKGAVFGRIANPKGPRADSQPDAPGKGSRLARRRSGR